MNVLSTNQVLLLIFLCQICNVAMTFAVKDFFQFFSDGFDKIRCQFKICCNEEWITSNIKALENDLNTKVHGQHLVERTVLSHIKGHLRVGNPPKALVLSFHGPTGVGKNFVSKIIAENLYKNGLHNNFVHLISATKEFPHEGMVEFYKDKLKSWIEGNVSICEQSMFIFDEVDKMPSLLLDTIKPYLDYYEHLGGINYRRTIFLFLSNTGSSIVANNMLKHWKSGKKREDFELRNVEHDIMLSAINDDNHNGLWHSQVISKSLVTAYIPFLPLERSHIRLCILDVLIAKGFHKHRHSIPDRVVSKIVEELTFFPDTEKLFSITGCKRVSEKVDFVMLNSKVKDEL